MLTKKRFVSRSLNIQFRIIFNHFFKVFKYYNIILSFFLIKGGFDNASNRSEVINRHTHFGSLLACIKIATMKTFYLSLGINQNGEVFFNISIDYTNDSNNLTSTMFITYYYIYSIKTTYKNTHKNTYIFFLPLWTR